MDVFDQRRSHITSKIQLSTGKSAASPAPYLLLQDRIPDVRWICVLGRYMPRVTVVENFGDGALYTAVLCVVAEGNCPAHYIDIDIDHDAIGRLLDKNKRVFRRPLTTIVTYDGKVGHRVDVTELPELPAGDSRTIPIVSLSALVAGLPDMFYAKDYVELNGLNAALTPSEAIAHYEREGRALMRLVNRRQLYVNQEFGYEVNHYLPYYKYLFEQGLLRDNVVHTFAGMEPYYYFLPAAQLNVDRKKRCTTALDPLLVNGAFFRPNGRLDKRYWSAPDYVARYANDAIVPVTGKPFLIVCNKYNEEWDGVSVNYIDAPTLDAILGHVIDRYTVVYIRPGGAAVARGFSLDHNEMLDAYDDDYELLRTPRYAGRVVLFQDLLAANGTLGYNEVKCMLFANCQRYITMQGGGANLLPYFARNLAVLHIRGAELKEGMYERWFRDADDVVTVSRSRESLVDTVLAQF